MTAPDTHRLQAQLEQLPAEPGVYLFKDIAGDIIYVGKAQSLRPRVRSYFQPSADLPPRLQLLVEQASDLDFFVAASDLEALVLEFGLIQKHRPRFNVRYRDDKSYPYLRVDPRAPFPSLCVVRRMLPDGARYFGPFPSTRSMWRTIRLVRRLFGIRQSLVATVKKRGGCSWKPERGSRKRPCLEYFIKQCLGPCVAGLTTGEVYANVVREVCDFLDGRHQQVLARLKGEMERAAAQLRYEAAARIRDQIGAIEAVLAGQRVMSSRRRDADAIGYALREDTGCLAVLQIREGRLIAQEYQLLEGVSGVPAPEVLNEFVKQHYQRAAAAPQRVLLPAPIEDAAAVAKLLRERGGTGVRIWAPLRGEMAGLVRMAMENAEHHLRAVLEQESGAALRGEEAVADLRKVLGLPVPPHRIEAFDISNISGKQAVGSMIVFEAGHPKTSDYRRFRIRLGDDRAPDDYQMMREVLARRLKAAVSGNVRFERLPDLLLVDGGPGQLALAVRAMDELSLRIPAAGLAKQHEHIYVPGRKAPISLPEHSRALHLLQRLRDEAHRFALAYHRRLRALALRASVLDDIPAIGPRRKQKLLRHFRTLTALQQASPAEIALVAACTEETAQDVVSHLRQAELV